MCLNPNYITYKQLFYFSETWFVSCKLEKIMRMRRMNVRKPPSPAHRLCRAHGRRRRRSDSGSPVLTNGHHRLSGQLISIPRRRQHREAHGVGSLPSQRHRGGCGISSGVSTRPILMPGQVAMPSDPPCSPRYQVVLISGLLHF